MLAPLISRVPRVIRVFTYLQLQGYASHALTFMLNVRLVVIRTLAQLVTLGMDLILQQYLERLFVVNAISKFQTVTTAFKSTIVCIVPPRMDLLPHCTAWTASYSKSQAVFSARSHRPHVINATPHLSFSMEHAFSAIFIIIFVPVAKLMQSFKHLNVSSASRAFMLVWIQLQTATSVYPAQKPCVNASNAQAQRSAQNANFPTFLAQPINAHNVSFLT